MPVHGLPCALETALNALVGENRLSSWKVTGGEVFCSVTLRFQQGSSMADHGTVGSIQSQSYRSKPPSAVKRDSQRKAKWNTSKQNIDRKASEGSILQDNSILLETTRKDNSELHTVKSQLGESRPSIDFVCDSGEGSMPLQPANTGQVMTQDNVNIPSADQENIHVTQEENTDFYPCDVCKSNIPTKPKTVCFTCNYCNDFAICSDCKNKGKHQEHSDQLHRFTVPNIGISCYCRSCGLVFHSNRTKLYDCSSCQDNYIICVKCFSENMHQRHSESLELKTKEEYYRL